MLNRRLLSSSSRYGAVPRGPLLRRALSTRPLLTYDPITRQSSGTIQLTDITPKPTPTSTVTTTPTHQHSLLCDHAVGSVYASPLVSQSGGLRNPAIRITVLGLIANLAIALGKGIGGIVFHSQALLADSVHSLSDTISDILTLSTISLANRPGDAKFPLGFGKIETVGALAVSGLVVSGGMGIGIAGVQNVLEAVGGVDASWMGDIPLVHSHSHGHDHGHDHHHHHHHHAIADINAAYLALGSIVIKEYLYRSTMAVALKTQSSVLLANAWHHRVDCLTSAVAMSTILASNWWGIEWLDAVGGILVSGLIVRAGYKNAKRAMLELLDKNMDPQDERFVDFKRNTQRRLTVMGLTLEELTLRPSGSNLSTTMVVGVSSLPSSSLTLRTMNKMTEQIKAALFEDNRGLKSIQISYK